MYTSKIKVISLIENNDCYRISEDSYGVNSITNSIYTFGNDQ